jgi:hypothetical protein
MTRTNAREIAVHYSFELGAWMVAIFSISTIKRNE